MPKTYAEIQESRQATLDSFASSHTVRTFAGLSREELEASFDLLPETHPEKSSLMTGDVDEYPDPNSLPNYRIVERVPLIITRRLRPGARRQRVYVVDGQVVTSVI